MPSVVEQYRLLHCDIRDAARHVEPGSLDAIVTDPPYAREHLDTFAHLSEFAAHALRPGGSALVMSGHMFLYEVMERLQRHLRYCWTLAYMMPGAPQRVYTLNLLQSWKPVLWFSNGRYHGVGKQELIEEPRCDMVTSDARDKRFHEWGQSESGMARLLRMFTLPGQLVCDPFVGGGTTGVVAVRLGRRFVGMDCDEAAIRTTAGRLRRLDHEL